MLIACLLIGQNLFAAGGGPGITADQALQLLKEGNARFVAGVPTHNHQDEARRIDTALNGQHPFATVIGCSDSRVPVEIIFDQGIGDTFIIRVAGNVIDTDEAGSIEYGVAHLNTPILVVLGHSSCGACTAVVQGAQLTGNIPPLVDNIIPAKDKVVAANPTLTGNALVAAVIKQNVWQGIEDLFEISPISADLVRTGKLKVIGAVYNLQSGQVEWLGEHPDQKNILFPVVTVDPWDAAKVYNKGDKVSYNGKTWVAGWWNQNNVPGSSQWGPWTEVK